MAHPSGLSPSNGLVQCQFEHERFCYPLVPAVLRGLQVISYLAGRTDTAQDGIGWACAGLSRLF